MRIGVFGLIAAGSIAAAAAVSGLFIGDRPHTLYVDGEPVCLEFDRPVEGGLVRPPVFALVVRENKACFTTLKPGQATAQLYVTGRSKPLQYSLRYSKGAPAAEIRVLLRSNDHDLAEANEPAAATAQATSAPGPRYRLLVPASATTPAKQVEEQDEVTATLKRLIDLLEHHSVTDADRAEPKNNAMGLLPFLVDPSPVSTADEPPTPVADTFTRPKPALEDAKHPETSQKTLRKTEPDILEPTADNPPVPIAAAQVIRSRVAAPKADSPSVPVANGVAQVAGARTREVVAGKGYQPLTIDTSERLDVFFNASLAPGKNVYRITYTLGNRGRYPLVTDPNSFSVRFNGRLIPARLNQRSSSGYAGWVPPGFEEVGSLTFEAPKEEGTLSLEVRLLRLSPTRDTIVIKRYWKLVQMPVVLPTE